MTLLVALAGTSFADEAGSITSDWADGTVSATLQGLTGNGVALEASELHALQPGCFYVKYTVKIDHGIDKHGAHLGSDFCYDGTAQTYDRSTTEYFNFGIAPWVNSVTFWICKNAPNATDPCGPSFDLTVGGPAFEL